MIRQLDRRVFLDERRRRLGRLLRGNRRNVRQRKSEMAGMRMAASYDVLQRHALKGVPYT
jgi:hypothetical protein